MGHKAVKEYYKIEHIVAIHDHERYGGRCICIGSRYIHDIIVIRIKDAKIIRRYTETYHADLTQYQELLDKDEQNGTLKELIDKVDTFEKNLPVYTIQNWTVVKEFCEEYGWPHTTHSGNQMYDNTYFQSRKEAYEYLLRDTTSGIIYCHFNENVREGSNRIKRAFLSLSRGVWFWILARTVGRLTVIKKNTIP